MLKEIKLLSPVCYMINMLAAALILITTSKKNGPGERSLRCDVCARSFLTSKVDPLRRLSTICACVKEAIRSFQAQILAADPIYRRKVKYAKSSLLKCVKAYLTAFVSRCENI